MITIPTDIQRMLDDEEEDRCTRAMYEDFKA